MEKANTKSALKFVKNTSRSAAEWSNTNSRGMTMGVSQTKELKEKLHDKNKQASRKSPPKDNTKPQEFKLHTQERAVKRAMFNYAVTTKFYLMEIQKKREEKLLKMIEEEQVRLMRKEMVPRAQLMPYFDRPFLPQRSSRPLTIPREPSFISKRWSCEPGYEFYNLFHHPALMMKPVK
ncbi:hypothetical protein QN277_018144 [Acacia crassicarpa]|uniref:TPX2 C-terminal domain-containing protein n=1 Tax=Acacia crassicarpa TaxID=499986 RepID=A0AAE1JTX3_9FABA|nr:hypothetical protein QN277_018144 [Acacia crassicarpa]